MSIAPAPRPLTEDERRFIAALKVGTCPVCGSPLLDAHFKRSGERSDGVIVAGGCAAHGFWELLGDPPVGYRVSAQPA